MRTDEDGGSAINTNIYPPGYAVGWRGTDEKHPMGLAKPLKAKGGYLKRGVRRLAESVNKLVRCALGIQLLSLRIAKSFEHGFGTRHTMASPGTPSLKSRSRCEITQASEELTSHWLENSSSLEQPVTHKIANQPLGE